MPPRRLTYESIVETAQDKGYLLSIDIETFIKEQIRLGVSASDMKVKLCCGRILSYQYTAGEQQYLYHHCQISTELHKFAKTGGMVR